MKEMEHRCDLSEALMAETLARRLKVAMSEEDTVQCIRDWFQSVRSMAQANLMASGVQFDVKATEQSSPPA